MTSDDIRFNISISPSFREAFEALAAQAEEARRQLPTARLHQTIPRLPLEAAQHPSQQMMAAFLGAQVVRVQIPEIVNTSQPEIDLAAVQEAFRDAVSSVERPARGLQDVTIPAVQERTQEIRELLQIFSIEVRRGVETGRIKTSTRCCARCAFYVPPPFNTCNAFHSVENHYVENECPDWELNRET